MPGDKRRGASPGASPKQSSAEKTGANGSSTPPTPLVGERIEYICLACDHEADATFALDRYTGQGRWRVGSAFTTDCPRGRECLVLHQAWLAELGIEVDLVAFLNDPRPALLAAGGEGRRYRDAADAPALPSLGTIGGWHSRLLSAYQTLAYLHGRGISDEVIGRYRIGWDGRRLTFPMRGRLVKTRVPRDGAQMRCWPGRDRPWPLYPNVPEGWVLLVAGELDALCGRSAGLPAVSVTLGAGCWRDGWTEELRGRSVVVCFDNDETALAFRRFRQLRVAGIEACILELHVLGLTTPKGDLSDYLNSGGFTADLVELIRQERRAS